MLVSIVTISFNQGRYLERAIMSVLDQDYDDIEYIVVDPGSTDESREIISRYASRIHKVILSPDVGPADGLNKGFAFASGEVFGFLNADDVLLPGAVREVVDCLESNTFVDVVYGHSLVVDERDRVLRRAYSDPFSLYMRAYGKCVIMQPSTFFRASIFHEVGGFNIENRSNWDGELFTDMGMNKSSHFIRVSSFWSCYRVQPQSITGTGRLDQEIRQHYERMFVKIMGREFRFFDTFIAVILRFVRHIRNPRDVLERLRYGSIYKRVK